MHRTEHSCTFVGTDNHQIAILAKEFLAAYFGDRNRFGWRWSNGKMWLGIFREPNDPPFTENEITRVGDALEAFMAGAGRSWPEPFVEGSRRELEVGAAAAVRMRQLLLRVRSGLRVWGHDAEVRQGLIDEIGRLLDGGKTA